MTTTTQHYPTSRLEAVRRHDSADATRTLIDVYVGGELVQTVGGKRARTAAVVLVTYEQRIADGSDDAVVEWRFAGCRRSEDDARREAARLHGVRQHVIRPREGFAGEREIVDVATVTVVELGDHSGRRVRKASHAAGPVPAAAEDVLAGMYGEHAPRCEVCDRPFAPSEARAGYKTCEHC